MRRVFALSVVLTTTAAGADPSHGLREPPEDVERLGGEPGGLEVVSPQNENGWWVAPLHSLFWRVRLGDRADRPYSTADRYRAVAGSLALACAGHEGEPCTRTTAWADVESGAGYGDQLVGAVRVRGTIDESGPHASIQRLYLRGSLFGVTLELGRDAFAFGPSRRTQLSWGTNAPPLDHVRLSTTTPVALTTDLHVSAHYIVGRLRDPQTYPGTLVTIGQGQLDVGRNVSFGVIQLLQLGGDGAPHLGVWDFLAEHVHRGDSSASASDTSNRRFGGNVTVRVPSLEHARVYYEIMFEDIRRAYLLDAIHYDADHLVGIELPLGPGARHALTVEWHQTGVRSQEHTPRTTGFTNAAFVVGAPLGPDAESFYLGARLSFDRFALSPWLELARLSSDSYEFIVNGPINRISSGEDEARYRLGTRVLVPLHDGLWLEGDAAFERVDDFAFEAGAGRNNVGLTASIIWYPSGPLGRLSLN